MNMGLALLYFKMESAYSIKRRNKTMLCVIAIIDSKAKERLMQLEKIPALCGFPAEHIHGHNTGHITLATYIGEDETGFIESCKELLSGCEKFFVRYDNIQLWTSSSGERSHIVVSPKREGKIAAIQKRIAGVWAAGLNEWTQADVWAPHTTVLYIPGTNLDQVAKMMQKEFEPFTALVDRVEFSRVYKDRYEIVGSVKLQ